MIRTVGDRGVKDRATIMVVGEAPGRQEVQQGSPFVGPSGQKLGDWLRLVGIDERLVYYTNILQEMPRAPHGNLDEALKRGTITQAAISGGIARVLQLVNELPQLRIIVPLGNYAAYAFTPGGKVQWDTKRPGITDVRGSIYSHDTMREGITHTLKVIASIHPAAVLREADFETRAIYDWHKIRAEHDDPDLNLPQREHNISPSLDDIEAFYEGLDKNTVLGIDIETWGKNLKCVGFAVNKNESLVIPTTEDYWGSLVSDDIPLQWIKRLCAHPCDKIMQGGLFDAWWLLEYDAPVVAYHWDTLDMHHCLDPMDRHSLAYMASTETREPFWKDDAKEAEQIVKVADTIGMQRLYVYCGLDVTVMYEIWEKLHDRLRARELLPFYLQHYAEMHAPLLTMMRDGVCVDRETIIKTQKDLVNRAIAKRDSASKLAGESLWRFDATKCERAMLELYESGVHEATDISTALLAAGHKPAQVETKWVAMQKKGISDAKLIHVLRDTYGLPRGASTAGGRMQVDSVALKRVQQAVAARQRAPTGHELANWQETITELVDDTLQHRRAVKLAGFLNPARVDDDGRMRCTYKFTTKSGRLASSANPRGTGTNLQNFDRTLHHVFQARPGNVLLEIDCSQAESRVVKCLTGDPGMIEMARRLPHEWDEHLANAATVFELPEEDITSDLRDIGKRVVHATHYGIGARMFSYILEKAGYVYLTSECETLIDTYHAAYPPIKLWQAATRRVGLRTRELYTSWGRHVHFKNRRMDDELYKFLYSLIPQSEVGDLLNQYGLIPLHRAIRRGRLQTRIVLQVHDSLVVDTPPNECYDVMLMLQTALGRERVYGACLGHEVALSMPVGFALGTTWTKQVEWKALPTREQVAEACYQLLEKDFEGAVA